MIETVKHKSVKATAMPRTGRGLDAQQTTGRFISSGSSGGSSGGGVISDIEIEQGDGIHVSKGSGSIITYTISHGNTSKISNTENDEFHFIHNVGFDKFGHVLSVKSSDVSGIFDDRYLRKDIADTAHGFITFDAGWMTHSPVRSAIHNIGWDIEEPKGFYITENGLGWFSGLNVRGPILGNAIFGSPYFTSGWGGFGTQLDFPRSYLEMDHLLVRKSMKVYELVIHQVRGTDGSLAVTDTNKIDSVEDKGNYWRCTIDDLDGEMYMNFRVGDVIRCQTWEKLSGRYYMGVIERVGDKWFDLKKEMLEGWDAPSEGDIVVRWSNISDNDRKGLLYLTSSDSYNPYMDVRYGDWNATVGSIKARLGRLDGINDPAFPELYASQNNFGLYTNNFYGTGDLIMRSTGESVSRTFEVLRDSITMGLSEIRYELQVSQDSILVNPTFADGTDNWEISNEIYPWTINDSILQSSNRLFANFISGAILVNDPISERTIIQVSDTTVIQRNSVFTDHTPGKYALRFFYRSLLNFGTLEVGIPGSSTYIKIILSENQTYQNIDISGDWDGTGDFIIKVTGGVVNIANISFTSDRIANAINQIRYEYDTKLTFYAEKAVMESFRDEYDEFNRVVRRDYATQTWTYNKIYTEVGIILNDRLTQYSTIEQTATAIRNAVYDLDLNQYATTTWTSSQITNAVSAKASLGEVKTMLTQTAYDYTINISAFPNSVKNAAEASQIFFNFNVNGMAMNRRIEVGSGTSTSNFICQGGISANTYDSTNYNVMLWAGGTFNNAVNGTVGTVLRHDGSGYLARKSISWDTQGNTTYKGRIETERDGNKIVIDPIENALFMYNSNGQTLAKLWFYNETSENAARLDLYTYRYGSLIGQTVLWGGRVMLLDKAGYSFFDVGLFPENSINNAGQIDFFLDPEKMPTSTPYWGVVYRDGSYLKLKT